MTDIVSIETRKKMMSLIKGKNTRPEMLIRKALYALGYRFRLHVKSLPGKPDIVLTKYKAVIFVHGCFWHRHVCHLFKWPSTRVDFWRKKINGNIKNDIKNLEAIEKSGWRYLVVWECALKGKTRWNHLDLINHITDWIECGKENEEMRGRKL